VYYITSPILWLVAIFSTTVENYHHISTLNFAEDSSHVLERVVGFCCVIEYDLCYVVQHASMAGIVDDEECFGLSLCVRHEFYSITIHKRLECFVVNIFFCMNVQWPKAKSLESSLDISQVLLYLFKVSKSAKVLSLAKFGVSAIAHY